MVIAHEIGHMLHFTVDEFSTKDGTYKNPSWYSFIAYSLLYESFFLAISTDNTRFFRDNLLKCEKCLREMFQTYKVE